MSADAPRVPQGSQPPNPNTMGIPLNDNDVMSLAEALDIPRDEIVRASQDGRLQVHLPAPRRRNAVVTSNIAGAVQVDRSSQRPSAYVLDEQFWNSLYGRTRSALLAHRALLRAHRDALRENRDDLSFTPHSYLETFPNVGYAPNPDSDVRMARMMENLEDRGAEARTGLYRNPTETLARRKRAVEIYVHDNLLIQQWAEKRRSSSPNPPPDPDTSQNKLKGKGKAISKSEAQTKMTPDPGPSRTARA